MKFLTLSAGINNTRSKIEDIDTAYSKQESILTTEFRRLLVKELIDLKVINNYDKDSNEKWIFKHNGNSNLALNLHFNYSDKSIINGTEAIVSYNNAKEEVTIAKDLLNIISNCLKIKNRGIKNESNNYRNQLIFITSNAKNVFVEICFISNKYDLQQYESNKIELIKKVATYLKDVL